MGVYHPPLGTSTNHCTVYGDLLENFPDKMKTLGILLSCIFLLGSGCSSPEPRPDLILAIESFPSSLDPRYPSDAYAGKVQRLLFNGLLKFDAQLNLVPDLAEGYEYLSDKKLRFHIRKGVKFHDGKSLRAQDVVYTLRSILNPGLKSPLYGTFKKIAQISASDDLTLDIVLKEPFAPFLTALTVGIIPEGSDQAGPRQFTERPIGTGPYRFDKLRKDQWIQLKANDNYFETPPLLKTLRVETIRDDTTRVLQLLRGGIDLVQNAIPLVMADWLRIHGKLNMATDVGINYSYLAFNLRDPLLKDRRVREAIASAIDRDLLIKYQLKGFARKATGILAPSNGYFEGDVHQVNFDPDLAKNLLDQAGYPDPDGDGPRMRFTITYKTSNKRDRVAMARMMARQLGEVGIGVEVRAYEWGTFYRDIKTGNFQMYSSTWVGVTDPDIYHFIFHSGQIPPTGANRSFYKNPQVDDLLELARLDTDNLSRKKYYSQVQKIIALEMPYVSLWYEDNVVFTQPDIVGYALRPDASLLGLTATTKEQ